MWKHNGVAIMFRGMDKEYSKKFFQDCGRRGGLKSRRVLTPEEARAMVAIRESKKAQRKQSAISAACNSELGTTY